MSTCNTLITKTGQSKLTAALTTGQPLLLTHMAVGDGAGRTVTVSQNQTSLVNEVYRGALNVLEVDPANPFQTIAELVIPASVGGWVAREAGLYDSTGALIAVASLPDSAKPYLTNGAAVDLTIRMTLQVGNTGVVNLVIDPSVVLATRKWVSDQLAALEARLAAPHA